MTPTTLPAINAVLNSLAAVLLVVGLRHVKAKRVAAHKIVMLSALLVSLAFLASYVLHHALHGSKRFAGPDQVRTVYLVILLTHVVLAAVNLPMVIVTVWRAFREQFDRHRRIAKWTWLIWMYVSVTGVVIYVMIYQVWPDGAFSTAKPAFVEARAHHKQGRDAEALAGYRRAAMLGHTSSVCFGAVVHDRIEGVDTASSAIYATLIAHPDDAGCLALRGRAAMVANRLEAALEDTVRAAELAPEDDFVIASLATVRFRNHEYKEAAAAFETVARLDPAMTANIFNAGYAHYQYGNYAAARPLLQRAIAAGLDADLGARAQEYLGVISGSLWVCPMHGHITGNAGDVCSECKMNLEPVSRHLIDAEAVE